MKAKEV